MLSLFEGKIPMRKIHIKFIAMNSSKKLLKTFLPLLFLSLFAYLAHAQKIGLLMDSYVNERWLVDEKLFTDRIVELGGEVQTEMANGDPDTQLALAKKLIADGAKVLVVVPCDSKKASAIVSMAEEEGIPVISYDRLIMNEAVALYASYDNHAVGTLQATYALEKTPKGKYLLLNGPVSDNNAVVFRSAQLEVLSEKVKANEIDIIGDLILDSWSEIEALMQLEEYFMSAASLPDVIIAANDALANACIEALKSNNIDKQVTITGQDADVVALRNILAKRQSMTIYKPIRSLAHTAANTAWKLAKGERIDEMEKSAIGGIKVNAILLQPIVVDINNYRETVVKDGHVFLSEILNK